ncbi:MAG: hypothetical protein LBH68_02250, partial [Bifidobacteriaceae bacterium]|nr:hypothetical protein [Bifidobacteriaceae bacterium]
MNRLIHPVGPEPAAVYWRRRAAVLAGIVVVLVVLVMVIKALAPSSTKSDTPKPSTKPTASATATAAAVRECTKEDLTGAKTMLQVEEGPVATADVFLTSTKPEFPESEPVVLNAKVGNVSSSKCTIRNNAHNVSLNVVSGDKERNEADRIFDSSDCATKVEKDAGDLITLEPGKTTVIPVSWEPVRSQQGCRDTDAKPSRSKNATYRAMVTVVGVDSDETSFR